MHKHTLTKFSRNYNNDSISSKVATGKRSRDHDSFCSRTESHDAQANERWPVCMTGFEAIGAAGRVYLGLRWCWVVGLTLLRSHIVCSGP